MKQKLNNSYKKLFILSLTILFIATLFIALSFNVKPYAFAESEVNSSIIDTSQDFADDSVIVVLNSKNSKINKIHNAKFFNGIEIQNIKDLTERKFNKNKKDDFRQILKITLKEPSKENVFNAIEILNKIDGVECAEPNYICKPTSVDPNDVKYNIENKMWNLKGGYGINANMAWHITKGSRDIRVGVLDTGIFNHPDLTENLVSGYDFYKENNDTTDAVDKHGTHVAGIIGAEGNNTIGVVGVNWYVSLVPLQASIQSLNSAGEDLIYSNDIIQAINWAEDKWGTNEQIDIINFSGPYFGKNEQIRFAVYNYSGLFVWSAGNSGIDVDQYLAYNVPFDLDNLISVGAIDNEGNKWVNSNYSSSNLYVDIYAPGVQVYSTIFEGNEVNYRYDTGTSMAAPHVTGVAALMLAANPNLTGAQLKSEILSNADTITIEVGTQTGSITQNVKKLNAFKAVASAGFTYTDIDDNNISITGVTQQVKNQMEGVFAIPDQIDGKTVKSIGSNAFTNCQFTQVILPNTITSIGQEAFMGCTNLTYIEMPTSLQIINSNAFKNCTGLAIIENCQSVTSINQSAFENCTSLRTLSLLSSIRTIGNNAFKGCNNLQSITTLTSLRTIGESAFEGCTSLTKIRFFDAMNLTTIGARAFKGCVNLESMAMSNELRTIGESAFEGCTSLEKIKNYFNVFNEVTTEDGMYEIVPGLRIPTTLTSIGYNAFKGCTGLTAVNLQSSTSLTTIPMSCFSGCTSLTSITLPSNLTTIDIGAFRNCSVLTNIHIPASVVSIYGSAFAGCNNLNITVDSSNTRYSAENNILYNINKTEIIASGDIASILNIPTTVKIVGDYAFSYKYNLTKVIINGEITIGYNAFYGCANLEEVYFYTYKLPTVQGSPFSDSTIDVYVPGYRLYEFEDIFSSYADVYTINIDLTYVSDGVTVGTSTTQFGNPLQNLPTLTKTGYTLSGWYDNVNFTGTEYITGERLYATQNTTLYAKWTPNTYYLNYRGYGSQNFALKEVLYNEAVGVLPTPSRWGYTFNGWRTEDNVLITADTIWTYLTDLTLYGSFTPNTYTITFNGNGGTVSQTTQTVIYESVITSLPIATMPGYTFRSWNLSPEGIDVDLIPPFVYEDSCDLTLYAQYTQNVYNVSFNNMGTLSGVSGIQATFDQAMPLTTAPTKTGYTFGGYFTEENGQGSKYYNADMSSANNWDIAEDTTLYAYWIANTYTVILDVAGGQGTNQTLTVTYGQPMPNLDIPAPTRTGYTFMGYSYNEYGPIVTYYDSEMNSVNAWNVASNVTMLAEWTANTYIVTLDYDDGTGYTETLLVTYGQPMPEIYYPYRDGYYLLGIYCNINWGEYYDSNGASARNWDIAQNATLYASWEGGEYSYLTLDDNGGSGGSGMIDVYVGYEMPTDILIPTREGYTFVGYFMYEDGTGTQFYGVENGQIVNLNPYEFTGDNTIYAHWVPNQS